MTNLSKKDYKKYQKRANRRKETAMLNRTVRELQDVSNYLAQSFYNKEKEQITHEVKNAELYSWDMEQDDSGLYYNLKFVKPTRSLSHQPNYNLWF